MTVLKRVIRSSMLVTTAIGALMIIGSVGALEHNTITITQAVIQSIIGFLVACVAFLAFCGLDPEAYNER